VLFIFGFLWSGFKNRSLEGQKVQTYFDLLFFEHGPKPKCERMSFEQIENFWLYLQNATACPPEIDLFWPYCERAIPFSADIYTCCENDQFQRLKLGSIDLDYKDVLFMIETLKRGF